MIRDKLLSLGGILLFFALWALGAWLVGEYILPAPWTSFYDAWLLLSDPANGQHILITLLRILAGFGLALAGGMATGLLMGSYTRLYALGKPLILIVQGVPPLLWAIPLIIVLRNGAVTPLVVIALISFPTIAITISEGVKTVPVPLKQMLHIFAPGPKALLRELIFPYLKPFLISAVKIALILGIKASVVAEFFGANNGIGFQIQAAYQSLQIRRLFAWGMIFIGLILLTNYLLERWERLSLRSGFPVGRKKSRLRLGLSIDDRQARAWLAAQRNGKSILLKDIRFHYPHKENTLNGLDFYLEKNELAVISGPSGAGKTTLLFIMAGLLKPQSGSVRRQDSLGFVFQDDRFLPWRNNLWNVALPLLYRWQDKKAALSLALYLLREVGLAEEAWRYPDELSGGMKKRLAFARCFAALPEAILMDEPFSGLHEEARLGLWQKFFDLLKLHPVPAVMVTHYPEEVPATASFNLHFYKLMTREKQLKSVRFDRVL